MLSCIPRTDSESAPERHEPPEVVEEKATLLAQSIQSARHFVVFCGPGITLASAVPDFRNQRTTPSQPDRRSSGSSGLTIKSMPTLTHMALIALQRVGLLKHVITSNTDNLFRKCEFPTEKLSELHGNTNVEKCVNCKKEYLRDFHTRSPFATSFFDHRTGRRCDLCGGELHDMMITCGEALPNSSLQLSFEHCVKADLHVIIGSSLTDAPTNQLPIETIRAGGRLAIINPRTTYLDSLAFIRIYARPDDVMRIVMSKLGMQIPDWEDWRILHISVRPKESNPDSMVTDESPRRTVIVRTIAEDGIPTYSIAGLDVTWREYATNQTNSIRLWNDPFEFDWVPDAALDLTLHFQGLYNELPLLIPDVLHDTQPGNQVSTTDTFIRVIWTPVRGQWRIQKAENPRTNCDMRARHAHRERRRGPPSAK